MGAGDRFSSGHGGDIYSGRYRMDLSISINPLGPPSAVLQAYREAAGRLSCYPDVSSRVLRKALADRCQVPEEDVICSGGAAELIYASAYALRPEHALVAEPGFSEYERALRASGCRKIDHYQCERSKGFRIGSDIIDMITEDLDLLYLCNPGNPTGLLIGPELMGEIVSACEERGVFLVLDECYMEMTEDPERFSMRRMLREGGRKAPQHLLVLDAFTKTFAIPGLRLGFGLSASQEFLQRLSACMQPWSVSIPAQEAGAAALREADYLRQSRQRIREEMDFLKRSFDAVGIVHTDADANFILFRAPADLGQRCRRKGILIRDCSNFRGLSAGDFRVAVRSRKEEMELLQVLQEG